MRYTILALRDMLRTLNAWVAATEGFIDTATAADYPNDERIDMLETRLDALQNAIDALGDLDE